MDKEVLIHTHTHKHNGILFRHERKEILPFAATWMDPESIILSETGRKGKTDTI